MARRPSQAVSPISPEQRAEDLLAGRVRFTARDLLDLIHAINPTGRTLAPHTSARRYTLKSRLQSLLVRLFKDELKIVRDRGDPDVVGLNLPRLNADGCHARLDELDDEARSWVRYQLDLGSSMPAASQSPQGAALRPSLLTPTAESPSGVAALVATARAQVEEFDYEAAQATLAAAFEAGGGAVVAARPLLELLVETLAADGDALALEPALDHEARADAEVRGLLALAAARAGERPRALRLLHGLTSSRAADALASLAEGALAANDPETAAADLDALREQAPAHPALVRLADRLAQARASARQPAEMALEALVATGALEEADRAARALLSRWPDSAVAQRALRTTARLAREREAEALLAQADAARARGDASLELSLLEQARLHGAPAAAIAERLTAAEAAAAAQHDQERLARTTALLASGPTQAGLLAYLELPERLRASLRAAMPVECATPAPQDPETSPACAASTPNLLGELEAILGCAKPREAVAAVLALQRAAGLEPEALLAALAPHARTLAPLARARALMAAADGAREEARRAHAAAQLNRAAEALAAEQFDLARTLVSGLEALDLDAPARERASAIEQALRRVDGVAALERQLAAQMLRLDFAAIATARELVELAPDDRRAQAQARVGDVAARLRREWRLEQFVLEGVDAESALADALEGLHRLRGYPQLLLTPDGRRALVVVALGRDLVLREADVESGRLVRISRLRTPEATTLAQVQLDGDEVLVIAQDGSVLRIGLDPLSVRVRSVPDLIQFEGHIGHALLVPGTRRLWIAPSHFEESSVVIDVERWRTGRQVRDIESVAAVVGDGERRVLSRDTEYLGRRLFEASGARLEMPNALATMTVAALAAHPSGVGMLAVAFEDPNRDGLAPAILIEVNVGRPGASLDLGNFHLEGSQQIALSLDEGCAFVLIDSSFSDAAPLLVAVHWNGSTLEEAWRVGVPESTVLLQAPDGRRAVAQFPTVRGLRFAALGRQPPEYGEPLRAGRPLDLWVRKRMTCLEPWRGQKAHDASGAGACEAVPVAKYLEQKDAEVRVVRQLLRREHEGYRGADYLESLAQARARFPNDPVLELLEAERLAQQDDWAGLEVLAAALADGELDTAHRAHLHHLRAMSRFMAGDAEGTLRECEESLATDSACRKDVAGLRNLAAGYLGEPIAAEPGASAPEELVRRVRAADVHLAAGRPGLARAMLDCALVQKFGELQSLARLAFTWLAGPASTPVERTRMAAALQRFVSASEDELVPELVFPKGRWDEQRVLALVAPARAWLEDWSLT